MKRVIVIVLTAILVLILGIGVYYRIKITKLSIEKVLPADAMCYLRISDIEKSLEEFKTTQLWRNVRDINVELLLEKSGLTEDNIEQYRNFKSEFFGFMTELLFDNFFGQEIALALYPCKIDTVEDPDALLDIASNIILVTRIKTEVKFIEFISKAYNKFGQKFQIREEEYRGHQLTIIEPAGKINIAYVKIKDLLVIGVGEKAARSCLDVIGKDRRSLAQDKVYISTRSSLPVASQTIAFGNLESLFSNLRQLINAIPEGKPEDKKEIMAQKAQMLKTFDETAGLKTIGAASVSGRIEEFQTTLFFDKSKMDPFFAKAYSFKPQKNSTINFVPKEIIGYQWSNCFDAEMQWESLQRQLSMNSEALPQDKKPADITAGIDDVLGMSLEHDIIPALGNEIGGMLLNINLEGPIPIPELVFFVKLNDISVIEKLIKSLVEKTVFSLQSEDYKNTHIKYILLPFGNSLQPGYCCLLDEYLLIATRRESLRKSIDALTEKSMSLLANKDFQAVNFALTDENNAVFFLKTEALLNKIRHICEWGVSWYSLMAANLEAYQQKAEQDLDNLETAIRIKEQELELLRANAALQANIEVKEEEINLAKKNLEEMEQTLEDMTQKSPAGKMDVSLIRLYLDELVYPVLDGLKSHKAFGVRSIFSENMLITESFSKTEE